MSLHPCAGLWDLFFSEAPNDIAHAKRICAGCPLRESCRQGAVDRREEFGVWGGKLFKERQWYQRKVEYVPCATCAEPVMRAHMGRHIDRHHPEPVEAAA